jgi:CheY-like chemotaxis protein
MAGKEDFRRFISYNRHMEESNSRRKTILVVEDDADMRFYFQIILEREDFDLVMAENGAEALQIIDSGRKVDLILLDMVMPVMNGEEFFRVLRQERGSQIPVIFCSVDEMRAFPLHAYGTLNGVFLKGHGNRELKDLIYRNLGEAFTPR